MLLSSFNKEMRLIVSHIKWEKMKYLERIIGKKINILLPIGDRQGKTVKLIEKIWKK